MSEAPTIPFDEPQRSSGVIRLETLVRLRWLALAGQSAAVLAVYWVLGFPMPIDALLFVIGLATWLNLVLRARFPASHRLEESAAFVVLAADMVQLTALTYLTGGLQNPFAFLLLAPVMISATVLAPHRTVRLALFAMAGATFLAFIHRPLPWFPGETLTLPPTYILGVWLAILLGIAFIGAYAWRVADESRKLAEALAATEMVLAREQHLSQLDGLAAAAAHQLGTPLATITIVVSEIDRALPKDHPLKDDIAVLKEQAARCREILSKISSLDQEGGGPLEFVPLGGLLAEICEPYRPFGLTIVIAANGAEGAPEPVCARNAGVMYGLANLIENALDFAQATVTLTARWTRESVSVEIADDGPGFALEVLDRMGEPYLTTRPAGTPSDRHEAGGLGLGLFIAKTLLERSAARFEARNATAPERGARVILTWPRHLFEGLARTSSV